MKTSMKQQGSALVVSLITAGLLGIALDSYLVLISHRNEMVMRGTAWNTAIPVLEAGIEEALTHLNVDRNSPDANNWTADSVDGQTVYWKSNSLPDGSFYCVTNFNSTSPQPVIYSAGYVPSPLHEGKYISRLVKVTATNTPNLFPYAISARGATPPGQSSINLSGTSVVDGYNSLAGPYGGNNISASGTIATDSQDPRAINIGSGKIYGSALTGPGGGVQVTSSGSIGDMTWDGQPGIQPGSTNDNMNTAFPVNAPPTGTSLITAPTSGSLTLSGQTDRMESDYIIRDDSSLDIQGNVTLWVQGSFKVQGSGKVIIEPNSSLTLYVGGTTFSISDEGLINETGNPSNFSLIGLPGNTVISFSGLTSDFVGTINAPQANFVLGDSTTIFGAVICNTFSGTGSSFIHYDTALGGPGRFLVTAWKEM